MAARSVLDSLTSSVPVQRSSITACCALIGSAQHSACIFNPAVHSSALRSIVHAYSTLLCTHRLCAAQCMHIQPCCDLNHRLCQTQCMHFQLCYAIIGSVQLCTHIIPKHCNIIHKFIDTKKCHYHQHKRIEMANSYLCQCAGVSFSLVPDPPFPTAGPDHQAVAAVHRMMSLLPPVVGLASLPAAVCCCTALTAARSAAALPLQPPSLVHSTCMDTTQPITVHSTCITWTPHNQLLTCPVSIVPAWTPHNQLPSIVPASHGHHTTNYCP